MTTTVTRIALALALLAAGCATPPAEPEPRTLDALERALQREPTNAELSIRIGQIELERGRTADAYVAFRRAAELAPDDVRAVSGLALSADALGFDEEAAEAYARWEALEAANGSAADPAPDPW